MQVWIMAGVAVLLVLIGHLRAWSPSGEGKNASQASASKLLLGGARMEWTEEFGPEKLVSQRPALVLETPSAPARPEMTRSLAKHKTPAPLTVNLDVRPVMQEAAGKSWKFLKLPLRQQLNTLPAPAVPPTLRLRWSGDSRGNVTLVARGRKVGAPGTAALASFVIGNGSRSQDGMIEIIPASQNAAGGVLTTTSRSAAAGSPYLEITLIGTAARGLSPRQTAALGELLNQLEAVCGQRLTMENETSATPPDHLPPGSGGPDIKDIPAPDLAHSTQPATAQATARPAAEAPAPASRKTRAERGI